MSFEQPKNEPKPKELLKKQEEGHGSKIEDCLTEKGEFKLLITENVGTIVGHILEMPDKQEQLELGEKLIDSCIKAGIVEPSVWPENLKYPEEGHEDGFSFKWVNHYEGDFVMRYEGWEKVSHNLHVLTKEVPELKDYANELIDNER